MFLNSAPVLKTNGIKRLKGKEQYYEIPQDIADIIFKELGNSSA